MPPNPFDRTHQTARSSSMNGLVPLKTTEVLNQGRGINVALRRFFLQAFQADGIEIARDLGVQTRWWDRIFADQLSLGLNE